MSFLRWLIFLLVVVAGGYGYWQFLPKAGVGPVAPGKGAAAAIPVWVVPLEVKDFPVVLETLGTVEADATVTVKSRVDGQVVQAWFTEGHLVHKGERLFTLDDRTFAAQLRQAQANLARDRAQLEKAHLDLKRYADLEKREVASRGQLETYQATVSAMTASVDADQAQVDYARLLLSYTVIESPIDGVAGPLLVHPGNAIKNSEAGLVVIHRIQPVNVRFSVAESHLPQLRQRLAEGAKVTIQLPGETNTLEDGVLSFINNSVDATSGSIMAKARYTNRAASLLPGQYVRVAVTLKMLEQSLVTPVEALQSGQNETFIFVIRSDETAERRPVKILARYRGEVAIAGALQPGERVVVDGQLRLTPGVKTVIRGSGKP